MVALLQIQNTFHHMSIHWQTENSNKEAKSVKNPIFTLYKGVEECFCQSVRLKCPFYNFLSESLYYLHARKRIIFKKKKNTFSENYCLKKTFQDILSLLTSSR